MVTGCSGGKCEVGCRQETGAAGGRCGGVLADLPPLPRLRFQIQPPRDETDYPYGPGLLPAEGPIPHSTVFLSAEGSSDPEGAAVSVFWNVQDESRAYVALDPDPGAWRSSFSPSSVGRHSITLEVTEIAGLRQTGQTTLTLQVSPIPCARDGVAAPCSDGMAVPGGTFTVGSADGTGFDNEHPSHATTVASFVLDKYEITVGRFRRFLAAYNGAGPTEGAAAHPLIAGSGWRTEWNEFLPKTSDDFKFAIAECGGTWTNDIGPSEARPINCVTWFEAFAYCAWENRRLPTEAEWEYAAAGGSEQRTYPWGQEPPSSELVVFGCLFDGFPSCSDADLPVAGSASRGAGRWGHLDLAGSVWEWTLDVYAPYGGSPCDNCANLNDGVGSGRVFRGGDFKFDHPSSLRAASRYGFDPAFPDQTRGFRCAR
jgi:sulfatase modifying factor 1